MAVKTEPNVIESMFEQIGEYGKTRAELLKLKAVDKTSALISSLVANSAAYLVASRMTLFLGLAAGFLLGEWLGKYSYGFFIVAVTFALASILVYLRRDKWVKDPIARLVITKVLE